MLPWCAVLLFSVHHTECGAQNPTVWDLGVVTLTPAPPAPITEPPLYTKALLHESDTAQHPLPEIQHTFDAPAARPALAVSRAFTALAVVPLAGLLAGFACMGANLRGFPSHGRAMVVAVGYHACLGAALLVFIAYWIGVPLQRTMAIVAPLLVALAIFDRFRRRQPQAIKRGGSKQHME